MIQIFIHVLFEIFFRVEGATLTLSLSLDKFKLLWTQNFHFYLNYFRIVFDAFFYCNFVRMYGHYTFMSPPLDLL